MTCTYYLARNFCKGGFFYVSMQIGIFIVCEGGRGGN